MSRVSVGLFSLSHEKHTGLYVVITSSTQSNESGSNQFVHPGQTELTRTRSTKPEVFICLERSSDNIVDSSK